MKTQVTLTEEEVTQLVTLVEYEIRAGKYLLDRYPSSDPGLRSAREHNQKQILKLTKLKTKLEKAKP